MQRIMIKALLLFAAAILFASAYAANIPAGINTNINSNTDNFLGPIVEGNYTSLFSNGVVTSFLGEAGAKQFRGSATLGVALGDTQRNRFKLTGEYLTQDLNYDFFTGLVSKWVNQTAVGADYQFALYNNFFEHVDLAGYYAHSPSFDLNSISGSFIFGDTTFNFIDLRRIAGANADGSAFGLTVNPWWGAEFTGQADYDNVRYDNQLETQVTQHGVGGTLGYQQVLGGNWRANVQGEIRAPFNDVTAGLDWVKATAAGNFDFGVFGDYVEGKATLPNSADAGIRIKYLGVSNSADLPTPSRLVSEQQNQSIHAWAQQPAVYMPQVLAIADERLEITSSSTPIIPVCTPLPQAVSQIPNQQFNNQAFFIPTVSFFSPTSGLTYFLNIVGTLPNNTRSYALTPSYQS